MLDVAAMSARLALDLDHDAIRLLSHQSDGWVVEGVAALDSEDMSAHLAALRQRAVDLVGENPDVLLVLPRSQILYTEFAGLTEPANQVPEQLDGMTPYALSEIAWDYATSSGTTYVAAVALETLDEATAFASAGGFGVVGLTSEPPEGLFPRMPVFRQRPAPEVAAPLVLEPEAPPDRVDVAFSGQRNVDYAPTTDPQVQPRRRAVAGPNPVAALAAIPRPLLAAGAIGASIIAGAALWPEPDPDRFARGNADLSFTELPVAALDGLAPPTTGVSTPWPTAPEAVTVLRDPPPVAVPVILGTSQVSVDYLADAGPAQAFERIARQLALFGETRLPEAEPDRPSNLTLPAFPNVEAPGTERIARLSPPAPLVAPAEAPRTDAPRPVAALDVGRATPARPGELPAPDTPAAAEPIAEPAIVAEAPAPSTAPEEGVPANVDVTTSADAEIVSRTLQASLETEPLPLPPNAAVALLPPQPGDAFELGEDGFVVASPEGTPTPGGVLAFAATPPLVAPPRPFTNEPEPVAAAQALPEAAQAEDLPQNLAPEVAEAAAPEPALANPNPDLAAILPRPRPAQAVEVAAVEAPTVEEEPEAPAVPESLIAEALESAEPVLTASLVPRARPNRPAPASAAPSAPVETAAATRAAPRLPSRTNVAREATIENALPLGQINLIGVYGSANDRRALVRLPSGRFVKLKVGDGLDGGQVAQIGPDRLIYRKGGRTLALDMPNT